MFRVLPKSYVQALRPGQLRIGSILTISDKDDDFVPDVANEVHYCKIRSHSEIDKAMEWCDKIDPSRKAVIHCNLGISRSPAVAIGLMVYKGMSFEEAFENLWTRGSIVAPDLDYTRAFDMKLNLDNELSKAVCKKYFS